MSLPSISEWKVKPGKRALLIGVSYKKQKFRRKGSINDVESMDKLLIGDLFKFPSSSVYILAVVKDERYHHPTKKNTQAALKWLVKDCQSGDSLVFYFSGLGLRQPDFYQDEHDGFDETICRVDFKTEGMILDNEINDTIVRPLKKGVTLHAIIDACHSGTILDLPLIYNIKEDKWDDNRPPSGVYKGTSGGLAISFSACRDDQLATDTTVRGGFPSPGSGHATRLNERLKWFLQITHQEGLLAAGFEPKPFKRSIRILTNSTNPRWHYIYSDAKGVHIPVFWKRRSNSNSPKAVSPRSTEGMPSPSISTIITTPPNGTNRKVREEHHNHIYYRSSTALPFKEEQA
ncbi:hypothetical protein LguiB_006875 [Lonicera macranthoides]